MFCIVILRQGITTFSLSDIQEIDAIISGFTVFENKEAGPLILTWAVYLCLVSSLPKKEEYDALLVYQTAVSLWIVALLYTCSLLICAVKYYN